MTWGDQESRAFTLYTQSKCKCGTKVTKPAKQFAVPVLFFLRQLLDTSCGEMREDLKWSKAFLRGCCCGYDTATNMVVLFETDSVNNSLLLYDHRVYPCYRFSKKLL